MARDGNKGLTIREDLQYILKGIGKEKGHQTVPETMRFLVTEYAEKNGMTLPQLVEKIKAFLWKGSRDLTFCPDFIE